MMEKKKFSLLYPKNEPHAQQSLISLDPSLMIEDAVRLLHANDKAVRYFLTVLTDADAPFECAAHRAEILQDFLDSPVLVSRLLACLKSLDSVPSQFQAERSLTRSTATFGSDARFITAEKQIILAAGTLTLVLDRLNELLQIITAQPTKATFFAKLKERLSRLFDSPDFCGLTDILTQLSSMPEDYKIEVQFTLNALGKLSEYDVISIDKMELKALDQGSVFSRFLRKSAHVHSEEKIYRDLDGINVPTESHTLRNQVVGGIYEKLAEMLNLMLQGLFSEFCGMSTEIQFYHVAISLLTFFEKSNVPYCFPKISENADLNIKNLYDFVLLSERHGKDTVIPNDVTITEEHKGILICGANNSGKTVYLRSIATALLFAKNGLPIPAESAVISPYHNLFSLFASGEKASSIGTGAGRFEEEVSALSEIIDMLQAHDILFLNEIFQTTAYDEGAVGLYHILNHLNKQNVRWVVVSHLTKLFSLFDKNEVVTLTTTDPTGDNPHKLLQK